jgi:hypothetical protein
VNMFKKLIQYWQGGIMKTILRTPFFLILFTIFSISFSVSSATGQTLPVVGGSYMQQIEIMNKLFEEGVEKLRSGSPREVYESLWMESQIKKENAIVGELTRLLGTKLSAGVKNFSRDVDKSLSLNQRLTQWQMALDEQKKLLGLQLREPFPVSPLKIFDVPSPGNPVPPVINGSYMQQMAEIEAISKEIDDLFRAGKRDEGQKKLMERNIKKENAIIGEMIRLYGNNLSTELKNFALNIDASFTAFQREAEFSMLVWKERKRLGEPPVSPPGVTPPDGPPSDDPVEAAKKAKELAEQNVTTATTDLDEAKAARLAAEQKLADAKTALEKAEQDLEKAIADKDAELQVAEKAVEDARQILADAKSAWVTAKNEVMELENKLNTVKNTYKEAEKTTRGAERALFVAENNVRRLKGQSELPVVGGSYMEQPGLPVVGGSYMGQSGLPVVGGSYQGPPQ